MIRRLLGLAPIDHGQIAAGVPRNPKWALWVKRFVRGKRCIVCGRNDEPLTGHHIVPFHEDPSRELDESNVRPICDDSPTRKCHLLVCHLGDWRLTNPDCDRHAAMLREARGVARMKQAT